jgi:hypothetical protein
MPPSPSIGPSPTAMASITSSYLARDEFIRIRTVQDQHLNTEFGSLRQSIGQVKDGLKRLKDDVTIQFRAVDDRFNAVDDRFNAVDNRFNAVDDRFNAVDDRFDRLEVQTRQSHAYVRNNALKNPTLPIRPLVVYRPGQGIMEPDSSYFPRHADEFYSLRNPQTDRHRSMLAYLALFYDVQLRADAHSSGEDGSEDETVLDRPDLVVERLEDILGLNEDQFIRFKERAHEIASRPQPQRIKRSQILLPTDDKSMPRRQKLELRQLATNSDSPGSPGKSASSGALTNARLGWGACSTPSSQRLTLARLEQRQQQQQQSPARWSESELNRSDSPTNAFTSPREP